MLGARPIGGHPRAECCRSACVWGIYEQQGNTIVLWADRFTDRHIGKRPHRHDSGEPGFQALNPFMIFAFTPFIVALWASAGTPSPEPSTVTKLAIGAALLAAAAYLLPGGGGGA